MTQREREKILAQRNKWLCFENGQLRIYSHIRQWLLAVSRFT